MVSFNAGYEFTAENAQHDFVNGFKKPNDEPIDYSILKTFDTSSFGKASSTNQFPNIFGGNLQGIDLSFLGFGSGAGFIPGVGFMPNFGFGNQNPTPFSGNVSTNDAVKKASGEIGQIGGWKYGESGKWCAAFATWSYGGAAAPWGNKHDVAGIKDWAAKNGRYHSGSAAGVKVGDVIVWRPETCNGKSHCGIVASVNSDGSFTTVEGNTGGNMVKPHKYSALSRIDGYVSMADNSYQAIA